jgi:hypothetical protein
MKKLFLLLCFYFISVLPVSAFNITNNLTNIPDNFSQDLIVFSEEALNTNKNFGQSLTLLSFNNILFEGKIKEDLMFFTPQDFKIKKAIQDDIYGISGKNIFINSDINDNAFLVAGKEIFLDNKKNGGSLFLIANKVVIKGEVKNNLQILAKEVRVLNKVKGQMNIKANKIYLDGEFQGKSFLETDNLTLSKKTEFLSQVTYKSNKNLPLGFDKHLVSPQNLKQETNFYEKNKQINWFEIISNLLLINFVYFFLKKIKKLKPQLKNNYLNFFNKGIIFILILLFLSFVFLFFKLSLSFFFFYYHFLLWYLSAILVTNFLFEVLKNNLNKNLDQYDVLILSLIYLIWFFLDFVFFFVLFKILIIIVSLGYFVQYNYNLYQILKNEKIIE